MSNFQTAYQLDEETPDADATDYQSQWWWVVSLGMLPYEVVARLGAAFLVDVEGQQRW